MDLRVCVGEPTLPTLELWVFNPLDPVPQGTPVLVLGKMIRDLKKLPKLCGNPSKEAHTLNPSAQYKGLVVPRISLSWKLTSEVTYNSIWVSGIVPLHLSFEVRLLA